MVVVVGGRRKKRGWIDGSPGFKFHSLFLSLKLSKLENFFKLWGNMVFLSPPYGLLHPWLTSPKSSISLGLS